MTSNYAITAMAEVGSVALATALEKNAISRLQEICQQWKFPLPVYREAQGTFSEFGTEVSLTLEGEAVAFHGRGRTKKTSKSKAAQEVLNYISETKAHLLEPPPIAEVDDSGIVEAQSIWKKGSQLNRQHVPSVDHSELARETERLDHVHVGLDLGRLIQQTRAQRKMSQKDLAAKINEKAVVIVDYESGRALPNPQIISKLERALGVHLRGEKAGQPKLAGRGKGHV